MNARKLTLVIAGATESDLELALEEAIRKLKGGYLAAHESNDTGGYYFDGTANVPQGELPA